MGYPRMLEALVDRDALLHIYVQHAVDQVQRGIANVVPVRRWKVEYAFRDLVTQREGILGAVQLIGEWWKAAKTDVQYYAERPDIDSASIAAVIRLLQNLWSDV